jgi:hypothetical protein
VDTLRAAVVADTAPLPADEGTIGIDSAGGTAGGDTPDDDTPDEDSPDSGTADDDTAELFPADARASKSTNSTLTSPPARTGTFRVTLTVSPSRSYSTRKR